MPFREVLGECHRDRRAVHMDGGLRQVVERAAIEKHRSHRRVICQHRHHGLGGNDLSRAGSHLGTFAREALGWFRGAVPDRDLMAGPQEIPGHGDAHGAEPDESDFHVSLHSMVASLAPGAGASSASVASSSGPGNSTTVGPAVQIKKARTLLAG